MKYIGGVRMTRGDILVMLGIFALALVLAVALFPRGKQGLTVQAVQNGELLFVCSLEGLNRTETILIEGDYPLTLEYSEDGVRVKETDCPGQDCCHMGIITKAGQQIVCLPNRLVVRLQGDTSSFDAVIG